MKTRYTHAPLEDAVHNFCKEVLQKIKIDARATGGRSLPRPVNGSFAPLYHPFHLQHQDAIDNVCLELQPKTSVFEAGKITDTSVKETMRLTNQLPPLQSRLIEIEAQLKDVRPALSTRRNRRLLLKAGVAFICLTEGAFSIPVFEALGLNFLESWILGGLFGGVLAIYAHVIPWIITRFGKTLLQKRLIATGLFILTFALFFGMGILRANHLTQVAARQGVNEQYSPWPFTLGSLLLMLVAIVLPLRYGATKEEMETRHRFDNLTKEKESVETQIAEIEIAIKNIEDDKNNHHISSASSLEGGYIIEQQIIANAHHGFSLYKTENQMYRTDHVDCMEQEYPFTFRTHFSFINQKLNTYRDEIN